MMLGWLRRSIAMFDRVKTFLSNIEKAVVMTNQKYSVEPPATSEEDCETHQQEQHVKVI